MSNTKSIFAEALSDNRNYKNMRVNGDAVGPANARKWIAAVKALRLPAYAIRVYRYNHMGDSETAAPCDQSALYDALREVLEMVGVVNGAKLDAKNCAEEVIAKAMRFRTIDTSDEMAHAHLERTKAHKALNENETEETQANYDYWVDECKRLENLPGNCTRIPDIQAEATFVKDVETLLGDAIRKQTAKSAEEVAAEEAAKKEARKARHKAQRAAAKAAAA